MKRARSSAEVAESLYRSMMSGPRTSLWDWTISVVLIAFTASYCGYDFSQWVDSGEWPWLVGWLLMLVLTGLGITTRMLLLRAERALMLDAVHYVLAMGNITPGALRSNLYNIQARVDAMERDADERD